MPIDPMGISFSPSGDPSQQQNGQKPTPVQQAIQTLSLRIPRTVGAASGAPQQLLQGQGGAGLGGNPNAAMTLEALIRRLFGGGAGLPMPGGPPGGDPGGDPGGGGVPSPIVGFPAPPRAPEPTPTPGPTFPTPTGPRAPEEPYTPPPPPPPSHLGPGVGPPRAPGKGWI